MFGIMNDEKRLLSLTRIAFLNAIILSLLSIQFLVPPTFIILLLLIPVIFTLQTYISHLWHIILSFAVILLISLSVYGIGIFSWTIFYGLVGILSGIILKMNLVRVGRVIITATLYVVSFLVLVIGFGRLVKINWNEIIVKYDTIMSGASFNFVTTLAIGFFIWGVILSVLADLLVVRILKQVDV